jgi:lambda repressor-like predicted transcriptional regulator
MNTLLTQKKTADTWEWIKYRLGLQGLTFGALAKKYGVAKANFTIIKTRPGPKYERIIGDLVGAEPWDLWPDRYDKDHRPARFSIKYRRAEFEKHHSRWKTKKSMAITGSSDNHERQD